MAKPGQAVFGRDILFNLPSVFDWQVTTTEYLRQVDIDNVRENGRRVMHDYTIDDQVYSEMSGIYRKLDYKKLETYRITEVLTNGTIRV